MCTTPTQQADDSVWHIPACAVWSVMVFIHIGNRTVHPRWERKKKLNDCVSQFPHKGRQVKAWVLTKVIKLLNMIWIHDVSVKNVTFGKCWTLRDHPSLWPYCMLWHSWGNSYSCFKLCNPTCCVCSIFIATLYLVVMPATSTHYGIQIIIFSLLWLAGV